MERIEFLSRREKEVVSLVLQGKSNKQIALSLEISERTVEFHLKNIYTKLQVNSRVELILKLGKSTGDFADNQVEPTVDIGKHTIHNGNQNDSLKNWPQFLRKMVPTAEKEFVMTNNMRLFVSAVIGLLGIALIVGGIITDKDGAVVIGICVAVGAFTSTIKAKKGKTKS
ncbi:MAG: helix-turn-helix transcriptional regulator [Anaerolineae bacterium]|nr:helix-turn-helix transcriptional regulator [Anaerolineae bacterium]